jgi:uncharacterized repeat protein (TIGR03803 family)
MTSSTRQHLLQMVCLVCMMVPSAAPRTLYPFGLATDGANPAGNVVEKDGVLYGATQYGGEFGYGTVFSFTPPASPGGAWVETLLWSFSGGSNGAYPSRSVAIGNGGVLYGTTQKGGAKGKDTVFALTPPASAGGAWTEAVIYSFTSTRSNPDTGPAPPLVIGSGGVLYGIIAASSSSNFGAVFSLAPPPSSGGAWKWRVLYRFGGGPDGGDPTYLTIGPGGTLYVSTDTGGVGPCGGVNAGCGAIFSLVPPVAAGGSWTETVIYSFTSGGDGQGPNVIESNAGVLYGTAGGGGGGTAFTLTPPASSGGSWTITVLHAFRGVGDGSSPVGSLALGTDGTLYGTTQSGGVKGASSGTVYSLRPPASPGGTWAEAVLYTFANDDREGSSGLYGVAINSAGNLFGSTYYSGNRNLGTVFSLTPPASPKGSWTEAELHAFSAGGPGLRPTGGVTGWGIHTLGLTSSSGPANAGHRIQRNHSLPPDRLAYLWQRQ